MIREFEASIHRMRPQQFRILRFQGAPSYRERSRAEERNVGGTPGAKSSTYHEKVRVFTVQRLAKVPRDSTRPAALESSSASSKRFARAFLERSSSSTDACNGHSELLPNFWAPETTGSSTDGSSAGTLRASPKHRGEAEGRELPERGRCRRLAVTVEA